MHAELWLARTLAKGGKDRERALSLARSAGDKLRTLPKAPADVAAGSAEAEAIIARLAQH
jgi:hypothetical protein